MSSISPYITFNGNCREAMLFYQECFGGDLSFITLKDSNQDLTFPEELEDLVVEASLTQNHFRLFASDMVDSTGIQVGNKIALQFRSSEYELFKTALNKLSVGANVTQPVDYNNVFQYATLIDKFGVHWIFRLNINV